MNLNSSLCMTVEAKDLRRLKFVFPNLDNEKMADDLCKGFIIFAFPSEESHYFTFKYNPTFPMNIKNGWLLYNDQSEYLRMGIDITDKKSLFRKYNKNTKYEVINTYPRILIVPRSLENDEIQYYLKLCNKNRFPVLAYFHKRNNTSLWRSAKPIVTL